MMFDDDGSEPLDTVLTLPVGMTAAEIARSCREVAMEFMNNSSQWGKAELGMWLTGPYVMVTQNASRGDGGTVWPVPLLRDIDARLIERMIASARAEIIEGLRRIAVDGSASFVLRALIAGAVVRCQDGVGEPAWAPTGEPTRLADRVLSLFAVDYLARPGDYEAQLSICAECGRVDFESGGREHCAAHAQTHSLRLRRQPTLPYPPMGA